MTRYTIVNGPSKWDLMIAFFDRSGVRRRPVTFTMLEGGPADSWRAQVVINKLAWEDGVGEGFLFEGYLMFLSVRNSVHGYFKTSDRQGWIEIEPEINEADILYLVERLMKG